MATIKKIGLGNQVFGMAGAVPYGNVTVQRFVMETNSTGVLVGGDSTAAVGNGDEIILGKLPTGANLDDSLLIVSDAFTAATVCKIGFRYVDGVDDTDVPQDDDYFGAALVLNAVGRLRNATTNKPVKLPKEAYLVLVSSGAAHASAGRADLLIYSERSGPL